MFTHKVLPFGNLEKHIFFDATTEYGFEVIPGHGANLLKLIFAGQNIVDGYEKPKELLLNRRSKSNVLLPFPNRLKRGMYIWQGEEYFFEINDSFTGNALHGFRKPLEFRVNGIRTEGNIAELSCTYEENGNDPAFPFPFSCRIDFRFHYPNGFEMEMTIWNEGQRAMPVGMGWHPYFKISESIEEVVLQLPVCDLVGIDEYMIPTGKLYPYDEFTDAKSIGVTVLDNCFVLPQEKPQSNFVIKLESSQGKLELWQENFGFLQLFTPPTRDSLAIEPMTCNIDAFNNGDGLIELNPKERVSAKFNLNYHPKQ